MLSCVTSKNQSGSCLASVLTVLLGDIIHLLWIILYKQRPAVGEIQPGEFPGIWTRSHGTFSIWNKCSLFFCKSFKRTRLTTRRRDKQSQSGQVKEPMNEKTSRTPGLGVTYSRVCREAERTRLAAATAALINWRETSATVCRSFTFIRLAVGVLINDVGPLLQRLLQGRLEFPRQQRGLIVHLQNKLKTFFLKNN